MISLTFDQFKERSQKGNLIPIYLQIPADLDTPVSAFAKIQTGKNDFLLESVVGGEKWGRYSFLGVEPRVIIKSRGLEVEITRGHTKEMIKAEKDPLDVYRDFLAPYRPVTDEKLPRFFGGVVGFLSYDMVRFFEKLPSTAEDELNLPESSFLITDTVVVFDNVLQVMLIVCNVYLDGTKPLEEAYQEGLHKIEKLAKKLKQPCPVFNSKNLREVKLTPSPLTASHSEEVFCALVEKAKEYIRAGDIFQVVVSTRFEGKIKVPPFELYRAIRRINPSPYLYFLQLDDIAIVGASPELMVRLEENRVALRPIAGTRRRGRTAEEDQAMEEELKKDPKERAEHVMLVDLGRNDLGRVCQAGSVKVDEQEVVERYSHVIHLVSHVSGVLKEGLNAFDVIRATFPAGTLTGAPKIRAMEIIEELEGKRRGIYGGAVGYISFSGNMDMAITIRTALIRKEKIIIQAAAGIVYDSIPRLEYKECFNKAMGMMEALKNTEV